MRLNDWEHKSRSTFKFAAALVLALYLFAGCGLESPQAPSWSVSLEVPIASREFGLQYIIDHLDIEQIRWSADSGAAFYIEESLDTVFVADHLRVSGLRSSREATIGEFNLASGAGSEKIVGLTELYAGPTGLIAAFSAAPRLEMPSVADLSSAEITGGNADIVLVNNLGIDLDSVIVTLLNSDATGTLATIPLGGPIVTGDSAGGTGALSAGTLSSAWAVELAFYTPGGTILSAQDKNIEVRVTLPTGVQVASGTGVVSSMAWSHSDLVTFSAEHQISEAVFQAGSLTLEWMNTLALPVTITWSSDNLTRNGSAITSVIAVDPNQTATTTIDLSGVHYDADATESSVRFEATIETPGSGGSIVTVAGTEGASLDLSFDDIVLESATATLAETEQEVAGLSTEIAWTNGIGDLGLADGTLRLLVSSTLPWAAEIDGTIEDNLGRTVPVTGMLAAGSAGQPGATTLYVPGITALLQPLPERLTVNGTLRYGDGSTVGTISASDYLAARVILDGAAHLYLDSVELVGDVQSTDLASDDRADRTNRLLGGTITVTIENHLPAGAILTLRLADNPDNVITNPDLVFGPSRIEPAVTDGAGYATVSTTSVLEFTIDESQMHLFERDVLWVSESLMLLGPGNSQPARIGANDYINWDAVIGMDVRVGNDSSEGDTR